MLRYIFSELGLRWTCSIRSEPSFNIGFGVHLRMTNASIHFFRVGVEVDLLNDIRNIFNRLLVADFSAHRSRATEEFSQNN